MNSVRKEDIELIIRRIPYEYCEGKTFLIAGANGFIASYVIDTLMYLNEYYLKNKCTVIALCRNREKAERCFAEWITKREFVLQIQRVEDHMPDAMKADYIMHAASCSSTRMFKIAPVDILSANILGTYNLLEFAKKSGTESFLYFSSGAIYGEIKNTQIKEIKEDDLFPLDFRATENCYAEGKRAGEALCVAYWEQYGVPAKSIRISHTYGPGIDLNDGHVYSDFVKSVCFDEKLKINGTGTDSRPFCYIVDAVVAFFLVLLKGAPGEVYNMANGNENWSIRELAEKLVKEGFPERKLEIEQKKVSNVQSEKLQINTEKLEKLGWAPEINVVDGFRRTVESFEIGEKNDELCPNN